MLKESLKKFWQSKGFYVALAVVIFGSVLASYLAVSTMLERLGPEVEHLPQTPTIEQEDMTWNEPTANVEVKEDQVPVTSQSQSAPSQQSSASSASSSQESSSEAQSQLQEPANTQPVQTSLFVWPAQGSILQTYSGAELVYNETMGDWRTHNGTDIAANVGDTVSSPANLSVVSVVEDGQWGGTIELTDGETTIKICGVSDIKVKEGDKVQQGAQLGKVEEIPAEIASSPHLHIEVIQGGVFINPEDLMGE